MKLNILEDENLREILDKFTGAMLPSENYNPKYFIEVLLSVFKYIPIEDMSMEYYCIYSLFRDLNDIYSSFDDCNVLVTRESVELVLRNNIADLVVSPEVNIKPWLDSNGLDSNLNIPSSLDTAMQSLYNRCMELYDRCLNLNQSSSEVLSLIPALKSAYMENVAKTSIRYMVDILQGSVRIGRDVFTGSKGWLDFSSNILNDVKNRIELADSGLIKFGDNESVFNMIKKGKDLFTPLAKFDIPPIDSKLSLTKHRLITICADEGIGKTTISVNLAVNLLLNGKKVVYMCGETSHYLMTCKILSNYIYKKYHRFVNPVQISDMEGLPEDIIKIVNIASNELNDSRLLLLKDVFRYEDLYDSLESLYKQEKFDSVFLDHSLGLVGGKNDNERVGMLSFAMKNFKRKYPVCCVVLSHLSTDSREQIRKVGVTTSFPTKANANLSTDSDDVYVISTDQNLDKQGLLRIQNYKKRDVTKTTDLVYIKKMFNVCSYVWDADSQEVCQDIDSEKIVDNVASIYEDDEELDLDEI